MPSDLEFINDKEDPIISDEVSRVSYESGGDKSKESMT